MIPSIVCAQNESMLLPTGNSIDSALQRIHLNSNIDADSTYKLLSNWSNYPSLKRTGSDYIFYYQDITFGKIPLHVYIPSNYKNTQKSPCVLLLHGAVSQSHFRDINGPDDFDVFYQALRANNYIIIRPIADEEKGFTWAINKSASGEKFAPNLTFKTLCEIIISLKKTLNIDDNRIFAMGHSDGSDGAIGLGVYTPDILAGVVAYNSMLNNLFARDFYIRNIQNTPLYAVHSSLDNLRPIAITKRIIDSLSKFDNNIIYKEYIGYQHFDKHLDKDVPFACAFLKSTSRNAFRTSITWEADRAGSYSNCDWLKITAINTDVAAVAWHKAFVFDISINRSGRQISFPYYGELNKSAAVTARYNNNTFEIKTSSVTEIELLINPVMVKLESNIIVIVNNKEVYNGKVKADKTFTLDAFRNTIDREVLWVNSIKVKVN
jgi:predicted esterase